MAKAPASRFFDTVGNGTGTTNAATLNGSVTPVNLLIKPAAGEILEVRRLIISMTIAANNPGSGYAGSGTNLTNGFGLEVYTGVGGGSVIWNVAAGNSITGNHDWKSLMHDEIPGTYGTTQSSLSWRYSFFKDGESVMLDGDNGDEFRIIINDDLTAAGLNLSEHYFRAGMCKLK